MLPVVYCAATGEPAIKKTHNSAEISAEIL